MPVFVLRVQWIRVDRTPGNGKQMALIRYTLDSVRSCVWVSGRSSLHPINTETRGITGWFEAATRTDGSLDLDQAVSGELELAVERLTSGNQLYDRELRRRIDARRYPTIAGRLTHIAPDGAHPEYVVTGEVSFHGKTRTFEHGMRIEVQRRRHRADRRGRVRHPRVRHEAAEHADGPRLPRDHRACGAARRPRRVPAPTGRSCTAVCRPAVGMGRRGRHTRSTGRRRPGSDRWSRHRIMVRLVARLATGSPEENRSPLHADRDWLRVVVPTPEQGGDHGEP